MAIKTCLQKLFMLLAGCIAVLVLTGFEKEKDIVYFRQHMNEARQTLFDRCKWTPNPIGISSDDMFANKECTIVRQVIQEDLEVKKRDELIDRIRALKQKLKVSKNKERYQVAFRRYNKNPKEAGEFIIECLDLPEKLIQNDLECRAAVDVQLTDLLERRKLYEARILREANYKEFYRQKFSNNEKMVDELLEGRCKKLMNNPWYRYSADVQDQECNAAYDEKKRERRIVRQEEIEKIQEEARGTGYYHENYDDAEKLAEQCRAGSVINLVNCNFVIDMIDSYNSHSVDWEKYQKFFADNMDEARNSIERCRSGEEADKIKCEAAMSVLHEEILEKKETEEFERYLAYYESNIDKAETLMKKCEEYMGNTEDDVLLIKQECKAAQQVINKHAEFSNRKKLIEQFEKIAPAIEEEKKSDKYLESYVYFQNNPSETDGFIEECIKDSSRFLKNKTECYAAIGLTLERLRNEQEKDIAAEELRFNHKDQFYKFFRDNPDKIEPLLEGRCKPIMSDPWYYYDPDIQDKECNAANEERLRLKRIARAREVEMEKKKGRTIAFYRKNPAEAEAVNNDCTSEESLIDEKNCAMAKRVVDELKALDEKKYQYRKYFEDNTEVARSVIDQCNAGKEKDKEKCNIALSIISKEMEQEKSQKKFERYYNYYRSNLEQVKTKQEGRCKDYHGRVEGDILVKDEECEAVNQVLAESTLSAEQNQLLQELQKTREKLPLGQKDILYYTFYKDFSANIKNTEDYILYCAANDEEKKNNKTKCRAAVDAMIAYLNDKRAAELAKLEKDKSLNEQYRKYFREHADEIDKILEGRCKSLMTDPWYAVDNDIQDTECNAARSEKRRLLRLAEEEEYNKQKDTTRSFEYYARNIDQAEETGAKCRSGVIGNIENCSFAIDVLNQIAAKEEEKKKYQTLFEKDKDAVWEAMEACSAGSEKNEIKCKIAFNILNEDLKHKKDQIKIKHYIGYFRTKIDEARGLMKGRCGKYTGTVGGDVLLLDEECEAADFVVREDIAVKERDQLISELIRLQDKLTIDGKDNDYFAFTKYFSEDLKAAEDFIVNCSNSEETRRERRKECRSAVDSMLGYLEVAREEERAKQEKEKEQKEYYRKYFIEHPEEAAKLLEGRCKILMANPWYKIDPDIQDKECNEALYSIKKEQQEALQAEQKQEKVELRDLDYFRNNLKIAGEMTKICSDGKIDDLFVCNFAIQATGERDMQERERKKFSEFYSTHLLAAKYHLTWCKSARAEFDVRCEVASDIVEKIKPKKKSHKKEDKYRKYFKNNPMEAKLLMVSKCREMMADSWYFLDENMQDEKCDAAYAVLQ